MYNQAGGRIFVRSSHGDSRAEMAIPTSLLNQGVVETAKLKVPRPDSRQEASLRGQTRSDPVTKPETDSFCRIAGSATGSVTSTASISFAADLASNFTFAHPVERRPRLKTNDGRRVARGGYFLLSGPSSSKPPPTVQRTVSFSESETFWRATALSSTLIAFPEEPWKRRLDQEFLADCESRIARAELIVSRLRRRRPPESV